MMTKTSDDQAKTCTDNLRGESPCYSYTEALHMCIFHPCFNDFYSIALDVTSKMSGYLCQYVFLFVKFLNKLNWKKNRDAFLSSMMQNKIYILFNATISKLINEHSNWSKWKCLSQYCR